MRLGSRAYWGLLGTFLAATSLQGWFRDRSVGWRPQFLAEPATQAGAIHTVGLTAPPVVPAPPAQARRTSVRGPVRLEADPSGNLFVIDDGDGETIKELSPHGQLVRAFDRPPAPEMASVTDLAFLGDKLWVADLLGSRLHALDRRSGNWESQKLALEPYRIETAGVGERLLIMRVAAPQLFDLTDGRGEPRSSFGTLLKAQEDHALALDGYIARSGNGIVFAGKHLGVIASFSASGALSYVVRTVSPPAPPVVMHQGPRRWLRHSPLLAARSFAANDETLWVLTRRPIGLSLQSVIDLYRASNGGYVKSLLLPEGESWSSMTVGPKALYVASDKRIVAWPQAQVNVDTTGRPILVFLSTTSSKGENDES